MSLNVDIPINNYADFRDSDGSHRSSVSSNLSLRSLSVSPNESSMENASPNEEPQTKKKVAKSERVSSFINKLYRMVEDGSYSSLISWSSDGLSFFVYNATSFAGDVLPEYFKHSNFSSFVRLLNMYGFHKINKTSRGQRKTQKNGLWQFSHPNFQRAQLDLLKSIKRKAMDSEFLRRETGNIHDSFMSLQMSQTDLMQQFSALQEDFSSLFQRFEQTKKTQLQQQIILRQLLDRQGDAGASVEMRAFTDIKLENEAPFHEQHLTTESPLKVLVTPPSGYPAQFASPNSGEWSTPIDIHSPRAHDLMIYPCSVSPVPSPFSPCFYDATISTHLPPSPMPEPLSPPLMLPDPLLQYHH